MYNDYNNLWSQRKSIDNLSGFPIIVERYTIPVYKGSTLTTLFQFPFSLSDSDVVSIILGNPITLEDAEITKTADDTVSVTWDAEIIADLEEDSSNFRVCVTKGDGTVHTFNEISIKVF